MTYNKKTNTLTATVYEGLEPMDRITNPYGFVATVSNSLYNKLKAKRIIKWYNPNARITWDLLITKKANNKVWFYLP